MDSRKWTKKEPNIYERSGPKGSVFLVKVMIAGTKVSEPFPTLLEARKHLQKFKKRTSKIGAATAKYAEPNWREYEEAKRHLPKGVSLIEAAVFYKNSNLDPKRPTSLEKAVEKFMALKEKRVSKVTYAGYKTALDELVAHYSTIPLETFRASHLTELIEKLEQDGLGPVTIRNRFTGWRVLINWLARKRYIPKNIIKEIDPNTELPQVEESEKHPLPLKKVQVIMNLFDQGCLDRNGKPLDISRFSLWAALQFFGGFRTSEAGRFRYEWIQPELDSIYVPKWRKDKETGKVIKGAKTKDIWRIYDVEGNFWEWFKRQPDKSRKGPIPVPGKKAWDNDIKPAILEQCGLKGWPSNAKRDSFATYHISLYDNPGRTALVLKHKDTVSLYESYLGLLKNKHDAKGYFSIVPEQSKESFDWKPVALDARSSASRVRQVPAPSS